MKILDPSSATLTISEVHDFLKSKPPQKALKARGAYQPVNLHDYSRVKSDFNVYISRSAPHIELYPKPKSFIPKLLVRLKPYSLTKAEVLTLINLGIGVKRPSRSIPAQQQTNGNSHDPDPAELEAGDAIHSSVEDPNATIGGDTEVKDEGAGPGGAEEQDREQKQSEQEADSDDFYDIQITTAVIEEADSRFTEDQLNEILTILREEIPLSVVPVPDAAPATIRPQSTKKEVSRQIDAQAEPLPISVPDDDEDVAEDAELIHDISNFTRDDDEELEKDE